MKGPSGLVVALSSIVLLAGCADAAGFGPPSVSRTPTPTVLTGSFAPAGISRVPAQGEAGNFGVGLPVDEELTDSLLNVCDRYLPVPVSGSFDDLEESVDDVTDFANASFLGVSGPKGDVTLSLTFASFDFPDPAHARAGWDRLVAATRTCTVTKDVGYTDTFVASRQLPDMVVPAGTVLTTSFGDSVQTPPQRVPSGTGDSNYEETTGVVLSGRVIEYVQATGHTREESQQIALRGWTWLADHLPAQ